MSVLLFFGFIILHYFGDNSDKDYDQNYYGQSSKKFENKLKL